MLVNTVKLINKKQEPFPLKVVHTFSIPNVALVESYILLYKSCAKRYMANNL